ADYLGLQPGQCMMVAAHNNDLVTASQLGFHTAFVCRPTEYGPNQSTDLKVDYGFDIVADSFLELAIKLGC
ncbi:MAG: haloacid dehalogenase type II, partial [Acidiferrobacterales bacterium]